jgi:hypothetical protein
MKYYVTMRLVLFLLLLSEQGWAKSRLNTYLEGRIVGYNNEQVVLVTDEGTYWIDTARPLSFTRKLDTGRIGFWVQLEQIQRFRASVPVLHEQFPTSRIAERARNADGSG